MDQKQIKLLDRIAKGPNFLFLGQNYLKIFNSEDQFLNSIFKKYNLNLTENSTYSAIFQSNIGELNDYSLSWMYELSNKINVPDWLLEIANFQWNGVFSSSFNSIWTRAFQNEWRNIYKIVNDKLNPIDQRNKLTLHCTYLYGCIDKTDFDEIPPLSTLEKYQRDKTATILASRLPELTTPMGNLFIEGYDGDTDWFNLESLLQILVQFGENQIHIFNSTESLKNHQMIKELVDKDIITLYDKSLAEIFQKFTSLGKLNIDSSYVDSSHYHVISRKGDMIQVPNSLWNKVSKVGQILEESLFNVTTELSNDRRYFEYKYFLSSTSFKQVWSGFV